MITSNDAYKLATHSASRYLATIESLIINSAKTGATTLIIRDEPYCRWLYSKQYCDDVVAEVLSELQKAGYVLSLYYKEHSIAVDMGLCIKWSAQSES